MNKAQVSLEFLYIAMFLLLVLTIYSGFFLAKQAEFKTAWRQEELQKQADAIAMEINTAAVSLPGYQSVFFLPEKIAGLNYTVFFSPEQKTVTVESGEMFASSPLCTGNVEVLGWNYGGNQTVENQGGRVIVK